VASRDVDTIMREINQARDQLAATIDALVERANPRRIAGDVKARMIGFVKQPAVTASLVGLGALVVVAVSGKTVRDVRMRRALKNRRPGRHRR
jgi:hypothetical protein